MKFDKTTKRIITFATLFVALFVLTGCKTPIDPVTKEPIYITLNTTFKDMSDLKSGIFDMVLTYPLAQAINFMSSKLGVFFGIASVTLIINLLFLGLTFKSTVSMQKMQMIQPEINKIQKKYEGNNSQTAKVQMSQEMQRLFEKNQINPLSSLTSLLQLPILICMYNAVRRSYEVAHGTFLGVSLTTFPLDGFIHGEVVIIVIYIFMIVFQLLSTIFPQLLANYKKKRLAKIQHKPYEKTRNSNGLMMYGMVVFFGFIMLRWPAALSLYYGMVSLINVLKTVLVEVLIQRKEMK